MKKRTIKKRLIKKITPIQNVSVHVPSPEPQEYERKKVFDILKMIKPGIASKDLVEGMTYFFLSGKEIVTYNDKISITHPFKTSFSAFVKADFFFNIMAKSTAKVIQIFMKDGKVKVKTKGLNVSLPMIIDDEIVDRIKSIKKSLENVKWDSLPSNFSESINLCSFAASKSESTISCIKISEEKCIASDNNRVAVAIMEKKMQSMFIKASEVNNLIGITPIVYAKTSAWLHFKNESGCIFSIRRINGEYPDFLPHFDFEGSKIKLPSDLTEGTDLASIFTVGTEQPAITITIQNNTCILAVASEGGGLTFSTEVQYDGNKIHFTINPDFLLEMMKYSASIEVTKGKAKLKTENFSLLTSLYGEE